MSKNIYKIIIIYLSGIIFLICSGIEFYLKSRLTVIFLIDAIVCFSLGIFLQLKDKQKSKK